MAKASNKFALNFASPCNFDYAVAHGRIPSVAVFSSEELTRYADYIKFVSNHLHDEGRKVVLNVCGDDGLTQVGSLIAFARQLRDTIDYFSIQTTAEGLQSKKAELFSLWRCVGSRLAVDVCCDFAGTDDSVDAARYNLRWLFARGMGAHCVTHLSPANIVSLLDIFNEFLLIRERYPHFVCELSVDYTTPEAGEFDESEIRNILQEIKRRIDMQPALRGVFAYCPTLAARATPPTNFVIHNPIISMTAGGVIYPCYDVPFMSDMARATASIGHIFEDFSVLEARRLEVLSKIKKLTGTQGGLCSSVPWEDAEHVLSLKPMEQHCIMHALLSEYLPYRSNFYRTVE